MTTSVDSKAVVQRYLAAAEAADEQALRDVFAKDASWQLRVELPISGTWQEPGSMSLEGTNGIGVLTVRDERIQAVREFSPAIHATNRARR